MKWCHAISKRWGRVLHRRKQTELVEPEDRLYSPAKWSSALWDVSHFFAVITGCIFCSAVIIVVFGRSWHLRERIDAILPDKWFRSLADSGSLERLEKLRRDGADVIRTPNSGSQAPPAERTTFGLGSTKGEVRAIQGKPDEEADNTFRYGQSEVYFARNRVIGWRVSASTPLKTR